jgi:hypothetical protein
MSKTVTGAKMFFFLLLWIKNGCKYAKSCLKIIYDVLMVDITVRTRAIVAKAASLCGSGATKMMQLRLRSSGSKVGSTVNYIAVNYFTH